uniref:hypothetical protein n=1 Tax=Paracoccus sp. T5 TaxID=3402161 RepID=UPI003AEA1A55
MSMDDLRTLPERQRCHLAKLSAEIDEGIAPPEGKLEFERMYPLVASRLGTPAGDSQM